MSVKKTNIWKAVLVAPLGVPLSIAFLTTWESVWNFGFSGLRDFPITMLFVFLFGLPISYVIMLLLGLPYLLWLRSRGRLTWLSVCTGSAAIGSAVWAGYWRLSFHPPPLERTILVGLFIGVVVGAIFCLVAKIRRLIWVGAS